MAASALLAITIVPVLMTFFVSEHAVDPLMPRRQRRWTWLAALAGAPVLVIVAGASGVDLPDWSLIAALLVSVLAFICLAPQRIISEGRNPLSRFFIRIYHPFIRLALSWRKVTLILGCRRCRRDGLSAEPVGAASSCRRSTRATFSTCRPPCRAFRSPRAKELLQQTDKIIQRFPEVLTHPRQDRAGRKRPLTRRLCR